MVEIYVSKYFEHQSIHAVKRVGKMAWKLGIHRKWWSSVLLREERWPQLTCAGVCVWMQGNCVGIPYPTLLRVCIYTVCCCCSVTQSCQTLCHHMDCSIPGFPVLHHLPELAQTHVPWVSDDIQPSHPLLSPSPPAFNLSQHQGLLQRVGSSHQVAKLLVLQLQISPSNEYSGLISFRIDWFDLFAVPFSSVTQLCPTICSPMDCSTLGWPAPPTPTNSWRLLKLMSTELVMTFNHLILCCPLLLPPSIFPSIRIFWNEPFLHIKWPKYWSFSFSISPTNEY